MQTLSFNKEIYPHQTIQQAILDFQPLADITCTEINDKYICIFTRSSYPMEQTMNEFSNYVLALAVHMQRGHHVD